jgi:hypothetical protein
MTVRAFQVKRTLLGGGTFSRIRAAESLFTPQLSFDVADLYGRIHPLVDEFV